MDVENAPPTSARGFGTPSSGAKVLSKRPLMSSASKTMGMGPVKAVHPAAKRTPLGKVNLNNMAASSSSSTFSSSCSNASMGKPRASTASSALTKLSIDAPPVSPIPRRDDSTGDGDLSFGQATDNIFGESRPSLPLMDGSFNSSGDAAADVSASENKRKKESEKEVLSSAPMLKRQKKEVPPSATKPTAAQHAEVRVRFG